MANWYVSQKVAASGAGTSLAVAFKTIAEAITAAASNDTIYVYDGVYNETITGEKHLTFRGIGTVIMDGGLYLNYAIQHTGVWNRFFYNFKFKNYLLKFNSSSSTPLDLYNCDVSNFIDNGGTGINMFNTVVRDITVRNLVATNCTFLGNLTAISTNINHGAKLRRNIFKDSIVKLYYSTGTVGEFINNNFTNSAITLNNTTPVSITDNATLLAKWTADNAPVTSLLVPSSSSFHVPIFNNPLKNNYTLKYDADNNPIAFATFQGTAIGAFQAASNIVCKDTANGGDCDVYNITTDLYSLGIFGGKTNVGAIDNVNEKLYRTSDGTNNWGVFVASTELPKTHVIRNLQMFGTIIDRNGGQVTKLGSDFTYNYQIDVLVKWSDTLSKSALLAETSRPFVRFRLRPNESNYYVNNSGTLVGDGEPTYLSLVNSSDGGSGSLVPTKVTAKSFVCIIILQDA